MLFCIVQDSVLEDELLEKKRCVSVTRGIRVQAHSPGLEDHKAAKANEAPRAECGPKILSTEPPQHYRDTTQELQQRLLESRWGKTQAFH